MILPNKFNGHAPDGARRYFKGGGKGSSKKAQPVPAVNPAPQEDPVVIETKEDNKPNKKKKTGTSSLRIDRTVSAPSSGSGLNIPN